MEMKSIGDPLVLNKVILKLCKTISSAAQKMTYNHVCVSVSLTVCAWLFERNVQTWHMFVWRKKRKTSWKLVVCDVEMTTYAKITLNVLISLTDRHRITIIERQKPKTLSQRAEYIWMKMSGIDLISIFVQFFSTWFMHAEIHRVLLFTGQPIAISVHKLWILYEGLWKKFLTKFFD